MSKPIVGMLCGIVVGILFGVWIVAYFDVCSLLNQFCVIASSWLIFQLLGATIAAALGKPGQ